MYTGLHHSHILLRYFVLIMLVVVIAMSLIGLVTKKPFGKLNDKFSLYLLIFTHLQLLVGLILYFVSPKVQFSADTMKNASLRYWAVEHIVGMLVAIALITVARISSKKLTQDSAKHMRLLVLNGVALILIIAIIFHSGRPIL
ncbi:MAG TPA: cytochrome B [Chryseolinea sp.]|nr:cytochrome B [Chryseolinea sp.]HPH46660.1 cytochrome B [Chryseolinea sp.]